MKDAQVWMRRLGDKLQLSPDTVTRAVCKFFTKLPMGIDYSQNDRPSPSGQEWMKSKGEYYERYLKELDKISHWVMAWKVKILDHIAFATDTEKAAKGAMAWGNAQWELLSDDLKLLNKDL